MIPTALALAFVAGLLVPRTYPWLFGVIVGLGIVWAAVIAFMPDATAAVIAGGFGLAVLNATIGLGLGLMVKRLVKNLRRARA